MKAHESKEKQERFVYMRAIEGKSLDLISKLLEISKSTAINWDKDFKDGIEQLKSSHFIELIESYEIGLTGRIKEHRAISESLRTEISSRNLGELPTDKLVSLYLEATKRVEVLLERHNLEKISRTSGADKPRTVEDFIRENKRGFEIEE